MTAEGRKRHERNQERQDPSLPTERRVPAQTGTWLGKGVPVADSGVIWLVRPMPDGGWPVDQTLPRDDSFNWWVRSHCGHQGGVKQWAFYDKHNVDVYEQVFRDDPCRWTRCPERIMIENGERRGQ